MQFVDTAPVSGTRMTKDGYLVADVRVARTGIQQYLAREIGLNRDGIVNVYRPEETVFSKDSMATFSGKPVTMLHPPEAVTADNWRKYAVGDIGEDIVRDGEFIRVPIKLMDAAAINAVYSGQRELSVGYKVEVELVDGVAPDGTPYQARQIGHLQVNHLAIVPRARGGENLRIGDGVDNWGIAPITNDTERKPDVSVTTLRTVVVGDEAVETTDAGARVIEKLKAEIKANDAAVADAAKVHADALAEKDAQIGALKVELQTAKDSVPSAEQIANMIADRVALETNVKAIASDIQVTGISDADVRRAAVAKKLGDDIVADASDAEIAGMFKAVLKDAKSAAPVRAALVSRDAAQLASSDNGQSKYEKRLSDAWKSEAKGV